MTIQARLVFDSELAVEAVSATRWRLTRSLTWTGTEGDTITVPAGFETDFATVPRFMHWLFLPYGAYTRAAVLHDWLLHQLAEWHQWRSSSDLVKHPDHKPIASRDVDAMFRVAMRDLGVPWSKRWTGWTAVRWASLFSSYRSYEREFGKDAPKVLGMSLLALPVVLPGAVGVLISLGFVQVVTFLTGGRPAVRKARRGRPARVPRPERN
jgi:hypothetical protein